MAVNLSQKSNSLLFGQSDAQGVPGWSGLNAAVTSQVLPQQCAIGYLPVIAAAPTDLSTVYVMLKRSIAVAHKLQQDVSIKHHFFAQISFLTKAGEIWH